VACDPEIREAYFEAIRRQGWQERHEARLARLKGA
jgi:hypothetical protein